MLPGDWTITKANGSTRRQQWSAPPPPLQTTRGTDNTPSRLVRFSCQLAETRCHSKCVRVLSSSIGQGATIQQLRDSTWTSFIQTSAVTAFKWTICFHAWKISSYHQVVKIRLTPDNSWTPSKEKIWSHGKQKALFFKIIWKIMSPIT